MTRVAGISAKQVWAIIVLITVFVQPSCSQQGSSSRSKVGTDIRWREFAEERYEPERQVQLVNSNLFELVIAVSQDRERLIYSTLGARADDSECRPIRLVDLSSGEDIGRLKGHRGSTQCLAFARGGRLAVSGGEEGDLRLWDLDKGEEVAQFRTHKDYVRSVACSPVDEQAASGGDDGTIVVCTLENDSIQIVKRLLGHSGAIRHKCLVWSSDGRRVLSGSWDGSIRLWDVETGQAVFRGNPGYGRVMSLALSPNGRQALSSYLNGPDQPVILWDVEGQREINRFGVPGNPWDAGRQLHIASAAFSPDGQTALFGTAFGSVIWWDVKHWRQINHNALFGEEIGYVTFSQDGKYAVSVGCDTDPGGEDAKIRLWHLAD